MVGFKRAAFSNEAGAGSASIAHSAVKTKYAASEGLVALLEPFIDTVVICTMTALVIITFNSQNKFAYGDLSKYDNAIEKLMDLVDVSSSDFTKADVYNEIGFAFRKSDDFDNASKYYIMALSEDPNHLGALEYQGEMFVDLGQKDNALANLMKLKELVGEKNSYYKELNSYISAN